MTRDPEQSDDQPAASDKVDDAYELLALVEESQARDRLVLEEKYGADVRLLGEDDDKLLSYLRSESLSQKRVALLCLLYFHNVYPREMVREAAHYTVDGDDIEIRSLCVSYLAQAHNEDVNSILRDCGGNLRTREARPGDDVVLRCLDFSLGVPWPFDHMAGIAERIIERLNKASERDDSPGRATRPRADEGDQDN
jgi:hypothetical protein